MEHFRHFVYDSSHTSGGNQCIFTNEGHIIPLAICDGMYYLDMHPPTDHESNSLPHVFLTSNAPWDPSCVDNKFESEDYEDALQNYGDEVIVL